MTTAEVDVSDPFGNQEVDLYDPTKPHPNDAPKDEDLGDVAATGLGDEGGQDALDIPSPPEGAKVTFTGVSYDDVKEEMSLGDAVTFLVAGTVTEEGERVMSDGHHRRFFKVAVDSVKPA